MSGPFSICILTTLDFYNTTMPSWINNYKNCLQKRPIITKSITCALLFVIGDYLAQKGQGGFKKPWDLKRTVNFAIVGATYYGPTLHFWYCKILPKLAERFLSNRSKLFRVLGSVGFDQIMFTPIFYCGYYVVDSIVESRSVWQGSVNGVKQIKSKMIETLVADLALWPLATGINLWYVPLYYQVLYVNVVGLVWDIFLCHITKEQ